MRRPLKNRARVRLHLGTAEVLASVRLLDRSRLDAGESAFVQFNLAELPSPSGISRLSAAANRP